jgi:hypothetical protein
MCGALQALLRKGSTANADGNAELLVGLKSAQRRDSYIRQINGY